MTNQQDQQQRRFDYIKIGLASSERIRQWGERTLPN
jgi:DNA-directed RNA polymerase subunit beta'